MLARQRTNVVTAGKSMPPCSLQTCSIRAVRATWPVQYWSEAGPPRSEEHTLRAGQKGVTRVRVVVADDDLLLREGLASLLDGSGFEVVGQAGDGRQLLAMVRDATPDLVVADIRMPPTHTTEGLDAARVEVEHAMELLASGGSIGYLLKNRVTDVADFVDTLEGIANGASVVDPALVSELVSARRRDDPLAALSAREREVLALMAEGRSNAGIAHRLWVTEGAVEKHVRKRAFAGASRVGAVDDVGRDCVPTMRLRPPHQRRRS